MPKLETVTSESLTSIVVLCSSVTSTFVDPEPLRSTSTVAEPHPLKARVEMLAVPPMVDSVHVMVAKPASKTKELIADAFLSPVYLVPAGLVSTAAEAAPPPMHAIRQMTASAAQASAFTYLMMFSPFGR